MRQVQREMSATYGAVLSRDTNSLPVHLNDPGQDETLAACESVTVKTTAVFRFCVACGPIFAYIGFPRYALGMPISTKLQRFIPRCKSEVAWLPGL